MQGSHHNGLPADSRHGNKAAAGPGAGRPDGLACIDAPELAQSPWGQQARSDLQQGLPIGRAVTLEVKSTDRYGRSVAEVISEININLAMVEDGHAFADRVWQVEGGITRPWDFRRSRRSAAIPDGTTPGGRRYRCKQIGSHVRAQLLRHGQTYLDGDADGEACEWLR